MTILSSIPKEKRVEIIKLLDKEISIIEREISILNSMKEKLKKRIEFLNDMKHDRISLETYAESLNIKMRKAEQLNNSRKEC